MPCQYVMNWNDNGLDYCITLGSWDLMKWLATLHVTEIKVVI